MSLMEMLAKRRAIDEPIYEAARAGCEIDPHYTGATMLGVGINIAHEAGFPEEMLRDVIDKTIKKAYGPQEIPPG